MIVEFHPTARLELNDAIEYYEKQKIDLGLNFLNALTSATNSILETPERWPSSGKYYRRYLMDSFPYFVYYEIRSHCIFVFAVAHDSRKPDYWHTRLNH